MLSEKMVEFTKVEGHGDKVHTRKYNHYFVSNLSIIQKLSYGWNGQTIGFSVAGDFSNVAPNKAARDAATQLLDYLSRNNFVRRSCWSFYGHRDKDATICPGNPLYAEWGKHSNWHKRC